MAALSGLFATEAQNGIARRHAVMLGAESEQRNGDRRLTTMPANICSDGRKHIGLVRDLSESGLFVYSDFEPACGHVLHLTLKLTQADGSTVKLECSGRVVRVEAAVPGAAVGIAVKLDEVTLGEKA